MQLVVGEDAETLLSLDVRQNRRDQVIIERTEQLLISDEETELVTAQQAVHAVLQVLKINVRLDHLQVVSCHNECVELVCSILRNVVFHQHVVHGRLVPREDALGAAQVQWFGAAPQFQ